MWFIKITQIETLSKLPQSLANFTVDKPKVGQKFNHAILPIAGWTLGSLQPVKSVIVTFNNELLVATIPVTVLRKDVVSQVPETLYPWVTKAGFFHPLHLQIAPGPVELILTVEIGEELIPVGKIRGELETDYLPVQTKFAPIMLTAQGRSGTTLFMQTLSAHPEITTSQIYPFEINLAQHLIETLRHALNFQYSYWLDLYTDYLYQDFAPSAAAYFSQQVDAFYTGVAQINNQPLAHYFIEKFTLAGLQDWFYALYPQTAREIFLVRDYRDVFASILAFNAKRGYHDFIGKHETDLETARHWQEPIKLLKEWQRRQDRALLIRYEDLILNPKPTLAKIFEHLQVDASLPIIQTISVQSASPSSQTQEHITSASPESSIGRWRKDFSPELISALHESIGEALFAFGYEVPPDVSARFSFSIES